MEEDTALDPFGNLIWEEVKMMHSCYIYSTRYISVQTKVSGIYDIIVPLAIAAAPLFSTLNYTKSAIASSTIALIMNIAKAVGNRFIFSQDKMTELVGLNISVGIDSKKLEMLYTEYIGKRIDKKEAKKEYEELMPRMEEEKAKFNRLVVFIPKLTDEKLKKESEDDLNKIYNNKY